MTSQPGLGPHAPDEKALLLSIAQSPIASVVTDFRRPDNPIIGVNAAFSLLTGYSQRECEGRNCRFLAGPDTNMADQEILRGAVAEERGCLVELLNYRKDRTPFRNAVMIAPVHGPSGAVTHYLGSQIDVSDQERSTAAARRTLAVELVTTLTPRQREVLEFMVQGYRNKQIAAFLGIDEKTVKMHRAGTLARLKAATTADAIRIGIEAGLYG